MENISENLIPSLVICDLDNTFYEYDPCNKIATKSLFDFLQEELRLKISAIEDAFRTGRNQVKSELGPVAASHSRLLYLERMFSVLGLECRSRLLVQAEEIYWSTFLSVMKPRDGVRDFLTAVRLRSIPIRIVTDMTSQIQHRKIVRLGFEQLIDSLTSAEMLGSCKPDINCWSLFLKRIPYEEQARIWAIGDEHHDCPPSMLLPVHAATPRFFKLPNIDFVHLTKVVSTIC